MKIMDVEIPLNHLFDIFADNESSGECVKNEYIPNGFSYSIDLRSK